jgi:hypothetical protein
MRRSLCTLALLGLAATLYAEETAPRLPSVAGALEQAPDSLAAANGGLPSTLRESHYFYGSFGTRDPFRSLLAGDFEPRLQELVDLHTVQLVGVMWETDEIIAMLQDAQGFGYILRPGDAVKNGSVVSVTQDALLARLNIFGQSTSLTLRLQRQE